METVSDDQLAWTDQKGGWRIRQVLHHLTDDGNKAWANQLGFDQRPATHVIALLRAQRLFLAELVSQFPNRWGIQVSHYNEAGEKLVEQNVENMISMLTEHMQKHVRMIKRKLTEN